MSEDGKIYKDDHIRFTKREAIDFATQKMQTDIERLNSALQDKKEYLKRVMEMESK